MTILLTLASPPAVICLPHCLMMRYRAPLRRAHALCSLLAFPRSGPRRIASESCAQRQRPSSRKRVWSKARYYHGLDPGSVFPSSGEHITVGFTTSGVHGTSQESVSGAQYALCWLSLQVQQVEYEVWLSPVAFVGCLMRTSLTSVRTALQLEEAVLRTPSGSVAVL